MKLPVALLLIVAAMPACRSPASKRMPETTETKISLMAEALQARERKDYATAIARFEDLLKLVPNDASINRLLAEVKLAASAPPEVAAPAPEASAPPQPAPSQARVTPAPSTTSRPPVNPPSAVRPQPSALAPQTSNPIPQVSTAPQAALPPPGVMPTVIEERAPGTSPPAPPDAISQALMRVESAGAAFAQAPAETRVEKLMVYVEAQRELARMYAGNRNFLTSAATVEATLASIKLFTDELKAERRGYIQDEVKAREGVTMHHHRH